ncbi:MAG TPA: low molecular weight phosphotyrosine protein phosphatase [Pseudomonas xinjiangensis]|uniref:protein-tyrosine-phosphatase n=2 Tax=root TaxID=1 RepID=A0A7V1FTX2_9GAMM|nr:low molecular weight phosphotyrosine protein phosphatase [Halopseudomonas xinjiangensis]HEC47471.1 low molecular weight phosphotyrosine protein phosphatase [Halopseudomonas xinjiangensis]
MFKSILIVCVGNICRSPTAEAILKNKLEGMNIDISSAGLGALVGKPVDPTAVKVMAEAGLSLPEHKARQITPEMIREADLILAMENRHLQSIHSLAPEARGKTFLFGRWLNGCEAPDPYRQSQPAFVHVYSILDKSANAWLPYLKK